MKLRCIANVNLEKHKDEIQAYTKEVNEYDNHIQQMEESETYALTHADKIVIEPKEPEFERDFIDVNINTRLIVGYEITNNIKEKEIVVLLDASKAGNHAYLIKYDEKIITYLDSLLE